MYNRGRRITRKLPGPTNGAQEVEMRETRHKQAHMQGSPVMGTGILIVELIAVVWV